MLDGTVKSARIWSEDIFANAGAEDREAMATVNFLVVKSVATLLPMLGPAPRMRRIGLVVVILKWD